MILRNICHYSHIIVKPVHSMKIQRVTRSLDNQVFAPSLLCFSDKFPHFERVRRSHFCVVFLLLSGYRNGRSRKKCHRVSRCFESVKNQITGRRLSFCPSHTDDNHIFCGFSRSPICNHTTKIVISNTKWTTKWNEFSKNCFHKGKYDK